MTSEIIGQALKFNPKGPIKNATAFMEQEDDNRRAHAPAGAFGALSAECGPHGRCNRLFDTTNEENEQ